MSRGITIKHSGTTARRGVSRRGFLKASAGTAALLAAVQAKFPAGVHVAQAAGPEVNKANLGFIALTDAAPLFVAKEKGIFAKIRHARRRGAEAGVVGRDPRQPRARLAKATASTARTS